MLIATTKPPRACCATPDFGQEPFAGVSGARRARGLAEILEVLDRPNRGRILYAFLGGKNAPSWYPFRRFVGREQALSAAGIRAVTAVNFSMTRLSLSRISVSMAAAAALTLSPRCACGVGKASWCRCCSPPRCRCSCCCGLALFLKRLLQPLAEGTGSCTS